MLRLMDNRSDLYGFRKAQRSTNGMAIYLEMAGNAVKTMTNQFAKKMVPDKIAEIKNHKN